jgi:hypothetical protein
MCISPSRCESGKPVRRFHSEASLLFSAEEQLWLDPRRIVGFIASLNSGMEERGKGGILPFLNSRF